MRSGKIKINTFPLFFKDKFGSRAKKELFWVIVWSDFRASLRWSHELRRRWKLFRFSLDTSRRSSIEQRNHFPPPTPTPALEYADFVALLWQEHSESERSYLPQPLWAPSCVKCPVSRRHRVGGGAAAEFRWGVTPEGRRGSCQSTCPVLPGSLSHPAVEDCFLPEDAKHWLYWGARRRGD